MNLKRYVWAALVLLLALPGEILLAESPKWIQLNNRIRVEYDDNVNLTDADEQDSMKIIEELELFLNFNQDQTFTSLRYRPSYVYWSDREPDDSDFNHDIDFVFNHEFSPRASLNIKDTFRIAELPDLIDRGTTLRENNDYFYNKATATAGYLLAPQTRAEVAGGYTILRYDDDATAALSDYDIYVLGLNVRQQVVPETAVEGQARYENTEFDIATLRGAETIQIGGAIEQTFNPELLGSARVGWENKTFEDPTIADSDQPYVGASLTALPSPATRVTAGISFSQTETDVAPFANQDRLQISASIAHDLTARVQWFLTGAFIQNELDKSEATSDAPTPVDGEEDVFQLSAKLSYRINRSNTVEAGWQYVDLGSDVRQDYTRNRLNVGWKTEL